MAKPIRIGILGDMADGPPADGSPAPGDMAPWIARAVNAVREAGRLDRDVAFVHAFGHGLPGGTAAAVEHAFAELAARDVLMIVGPAIGDNALVATPLVEAARIPTLNWAGAERARGQWMFHLQVGSHEDESLVIARHLAALGCTRLAVAFDRSPIGRRHLAFLLEEAELLGQTIVATAGLSPLAETADSQVAELLAASPDGVVYLGLGVSAAAVAGALAHSGWAGPRMMNTAGIRGYQPGFTEAIEGWRYVDMVSDDNATLSALLAELGLPRRQALAAAKGHDLGRLVAEGLARAEDLTREGLRDGLERVKWLPAAEGHEGTLLGFGRQDRGALHGRYLATRQWRGGETVEV